MGKIVLSVNQERKDLKDAVSQAVIDLDTIVSNGDVMTLSQVRQAIKKLAQHQKKIIKRLTQL